MYDKTLPYFSLPQGALLQSLSCQLLDNENFVRDGCEGKLDKCTVYIVQEIFLWPFWQTEGGSVDVR